MSPLNGCVRESWHFRRSLKQVGSFPNVFLMKRGCIHISARTALSKGLHSPKGSFRMREGCIQGSSEKEMGRSHIYIYISSASCDMPCLGIDLGR